MSRDLGPPLKAWVGGLLLQLEGSPLQTVRGCQELEQALGTPGERGKIKVLPCLAMLTPPLKCQSDTEPPAQKRLPFQLSFCHGASFPVPVCSTASAGKMHGGLQCFAMESSAPPGARDSVEMSPTTMARLKSSPFVSLSSPPLKHPHHYSSNWIPPLFWKKKKVSQNYSLKISDE